MDLKIKDNSQLRLYPFTQLEYIESTGTQYIDTGISFPNGYRIVTTLVCKGQTENYARFSGSYDGNHNILGISVQQWNPCLGNDGLSKYGSVTLNTQYSVDMSNANNVYKVIINGATLVDTPKSGSYATNNCYLFCINHTSKQNFIGQLGETYLYDNNNVLKRHFVPAKDVNNVVCMYDTVSKTFFYNKGTGNFVAGPVDQYATISLPDNILLKTTTLYHKNTPKVNGLQLIRSILYVQKTAGDVVLNRIRVDIDNVSGSLSELMQYAGMAGFNDAGEEQAKPRLVGTWTINDWYTAAQLAEAQAAFDGLTVVGDPNYLINFNDLAVQTLDPNEDNYNPAVAIILQGQNKGITMTNAPSGYGRWFLLKTEAATITAMWTRAGGGYQQGFWFQAKETVTDSNKLVTDEVKDYDFEGFDELKYFTQITLDKTDGALHGFFYNCKKLKYVTIPDNANRLQCTFWRCSKLERVTGVDHLTSIGTCAFCDCSSLVLNQSDINPNIQDIGAQAFYGCSKITINTIPAQVTNIAENGVRMNTFTNTISIPYLHFLSETPITEILCSYARTHVYNSFYKTTYKIYVGDGTSAAHDDAILADYKAASNWSGMKSYLDTWYNYLHPQS